MRHLSKLDRLRHELAIAEGKLKAYPNRQSAIDDVSRLSAQLRREEEAAKASWAKPEKRR